MSLKTGIMVERLWSEVVWVFFFGYVGDTDGGRAGS